ncbi:hypothetical protein H6P81_011473 [Aristolochia fimbriata]|uniref:Uncharacterized protein n=1 Tax=Aristolochia fimbriata TaxID=158543 RepID=A0AAV7ERL8_ARIFI|nr:hypothetical protein H6P81_011473 [Aristolochia fimbriata]
MLISSYLCNFNDNDCVKGDGSSVSNGSEAAVPPSRGTDHGLLIPDQGDRLDKGQTRITGFRSAYPPISGLRRQFI